MAQQYFKKAIHANKIFFPAASIFAALSPWLLVISLTSNTGLSVSTHAEALLFGFVGALIAGYLLGKIKPVILYSLLMLWLLGRISEVVFPVSILTDSVRVGFGFTLIVLIAPKFLPAKKWINKSISPLITFIGIAPLLYWLIRGTSFPIDQPLIPLILLISMLMFFMGGRLISPLLTKARMSNGLKNPHRVQPGMEAATMLLLFLAVLLSIFKTPGITLALVTGLSALLIFIRLIRWEILALSWSHRDIFGLMAGYFWLAIGLLFICLSIMLDWQLAAGVHVITIGAIGTLSSTIMLKSALKGVGQDESNGVFTSVVGFLTLAVICRVAAIFLPDYRGLLLVITTLGWSISFLVVALTQFKFSINLPIPKR